MRPSSHLAVVAGMLVAAAGCGGTPAGVGDDDGGDDVAPDAGVDGDETPDAMAPDAIVPGVAREIDGLLVINEFMAANALTMNDDLAAPSDWVELYNPTTTEIPLHGYAITDELANPGKGVIGPGVVIPAGGRALLWLDGAPDHGATHLNLKLRREGGDIGLSRPDGSYIDRVTYGEQEVDFSAARVPDGSDSWQIMWLVTPNLANGAGAGQPMGLDVDGSAPETVPPAGDLTELILGYDVLPELALVVSDESAASLLANPTVDVPAQLVFSGRTYGPVGLRLKGQNSFQPFDAKPSMRINVDEYVATAKFFGLKDLTLNNMDNDFSMMHERLAYYVARQVGIPASRTNHARITVNGEFYGLYTNVETVKKQTLTRWFADGTGSLFEGTDVDFVASYIPAFELETGPDDRTKLYGLASALTIADPDAALAAAAAHVDLDQFRKFWAMSAVIGQFDALPYSMPGDDFYIYVDPTTGRINFMPWGMDETFYSAAFDVLQISSVLAQKCKDSPTCQQAFVDQVWAVQDRTEAIGLAAERDRVIAQIAASVVEDTNKPYTDAEVTGSQNDLYWFIGERRSNLAAMLPPASGN